MCVVCASVPRTAVPRRTDGVPPAPFHHLLLQTFRLTLTRVPQAADDNGYVFVGAKPATLLRIVGLHPEVVAL